MKSFTARITVQFALLVTATMAIVLALGGWFLSREAVNGLDLLNQAEFVEIRDRLGTDPSNLSAKEIDERVRPHTQVDAVLYYFEIRSKNGTLLFRSTNLGPNVLPDLSGGELQRTAQVTGIGSVRICEFDHGSLRVEIASLLEPAYRLLRGYVRVSLFLLGSVAIASVGLGWWFARLTLRPVRAIHDTATRIRGDNLGERIPVPGGRDELSSLAQLLNRMFDGLEASFTQIKRFTADASHELKTPLALMRLNAEKLRTRLVADSEGSTYIAEILEDIDRMRRITESLLFLAKAESGTLAINITEISIDPFIADFAEDARALAEDSGARFSVARSSVGFVQCEVTLIRQLLLNLTSNAFNASPPGSCVTLESTLADGFWLLIIDDEGPGLPPEQLERVFERFVRYGNVRGKPEATAGYGLGLAICRSIASLHGGTIRMENRSDRSGLHVTVKLPKKAQISGG